MSRYVITIDTTAYKPMCASKKTWERGTVNDFMAALNGYKVTETSLKMVERRINLFAGHPYNEKNFDEIVDWLDDPKSKTKITYYDKLCGFNRTEDVAPYGWKQGYFSTAAVIKTLKEKGLVRIPFKWVYDVRQYNPRYNGCYMQIERK